MKIGSKVIHAGWQAEQGSGATVPSIVQSTSFAYDNAEGIEAVFGGREPGFVYSRINNPTVMAFERRVTALEGGLASLAAASGMAAISSVVMALAGQGDELVSGNSIFGGTFSLLSETLSRFGIKTRFVPSTDLDAYRAAITDRTKAVFVETVGNPKLDVPDIQAISRIAKEAGVPLVVDSTLTTPALITPKEFGADIVVHSASKYLNGHGNAVGGIIVDCGTFDWSGERYPHLHEYYRTARQFALMAFLRSRHFRDVGACMSPFNAFLVSMGLDSLEVRMERHCSNALAVAGWLDGDDRVDAVSYPGLASHPDYETATRQFGDRSSAVLTLDLGSKERAFAFINGLKMVQNLANIGDVKTLAIHPASTICRDCSEESRTSMGVTDGLVRISVGIEDEDDIRGDIDQALNL